MKKPAQLETRIQQWIDADLIDAPVGARILAFEAGRERRAILNWPVILAMIFGGILLFAGASLFVAAHWAELSPAARFSLVLLTVAVFHLGGAALAERFPAISTTLHGVGTAILGAAIFLTAQIFNLHEDWATGVLLWGLGALVGYILLRDWIQAALLGILAPAWLISQWIITIQGNSGGRRALAMGLILTSLTYLSARIGDQESTVRHTLVWIGGIALVPCAFIAVPLAAREEVVGIMDAGGRSPLAISTALAGWTVALAGPLLLAWFLRRRAAWIMGLWAVWAYLLLLASAHSGSVVGGQFRQSLLMISIVYVLLALGSVGLVVWGLYEKRKERVNLGILGFALSVLAFYSDSFMGKLGRSLSLLLLGILCLAGGYTLEITRRRLTARLEKIP